MLNDISNFLYNYCTDFCINASNLLGIDYYTLGSLFFGFFLNGVMLLLVLANILVSIRKTIKRTPSKKE